ncbi:MAG: response regulator [bacterium]|nr:response regulator [bacterium]
MNNHVLICDDDPGIVDILSMILLEKGYEVTVCKNSEEVHDNVARKRPFVILLDLWMPGLSGEEITTSLKADPTTSTIPVIILSASKDTEVTAKQIGADDFLCKPFNITDIENIVEKYHALS